MILENEIIAKAQLGDKAAKEEIYNKYLGSIHDTTRRFRNYPNFNYDDFFQIACVGFLKAINGFKAELGFKFITYLYCKTEGEIRKYIREGRIMKHLRSGIENFSKIYKLKLKGYNTKEIAEELNISCKEIENLEMEFSSSCILSLDQKMNSEIRDTFVNHLEQKEVMEEAEALYIKEAVHKLDSRQKEIIIRYFFKDETQVEISKSLGISQPTVVRNLKKALKILKKYMEV